MTIRRPPHDQRPLRDPAALTRVWASLLAGEPFRFRVVWALFLDGAHRPVGPLLTLEDLPDGPYGVPPDALAELCRELLDGPGTVRSVAFLLARPGASPWTVSDRAWARFLTRTTGILGTTGWPVHWAHRRCLEEVVLT